jgi:archaellum component FlaC
VIQRRESDLALATFGRGFYILDDYSPLRENATQVKKQQATLFPVRRSFQFVEHNPLGLPGKSMRGADFYFADNPEFGATFSYFINEDFKSLKAKRQSKEKQLRKDNKPLDYPSYSALKEEDFEQQSTLLFTVTDSEGNMIRRIKAPAKKGFNRIHWDLRYPGFDPIDVTDKIDGGWFAVPGNYSVALSKVVNGVETSYGQSQNFEVASLDNRTFASNDRDDDLKFDKQVGRLYQTISGARKYLNELESRIKHVKVAVTETLGLTQNTLESTHNMQRELEEIKLLLNGNSVLAKRAKPTVTSVYGYISYLVWSRSESTSAVNGQQKLRFARASEGYAKVYLQIKQLADSVALTEQKIAKADGSWLPGMMPSDGQ